MLLLSGICSTVNNLNLSCPMKADGDNVITRNEISEIYQGVIFTCLANSTEFLY